MGNRPRAEFNLGNELLLNVHKVQNNKFTSTLQSIDPGQQFTWEHSNLDVNKPKNRYANVIAYDHSRVLLSAIDGKPPTNIFLYQLLYRFQRQPVQPREHNRNALLKVFTHKNVRLLISFHASGASKDRDGFRKWQFSIERLREALASIQIRLNKDL